MYIIYQQTCTGEMLHLLCFLSVNEITSYQEVGLQV